MFNYATHLRPRTRLVPRTIPIAIATVLVAIAGLSLSGSVAASNSDERVQGCRLATLKGRISSPTPARCFRQRFHSRR